MNEHPPTPGPHSTIAHPDRDGLSWISALLVTIPGAIVTGIAYWLLFAVGVLAIGVIDLDVVETLDTRDEVIDFAVDKLGDIILLGIVLLIVLLPLIAMLYRLFIDLLFDHVVPLGWAIFSVLVGWIVTPLGFLLDALLAGLTLGLGGAIVNGVATAALLRMRARPKAARLA